MTQPYASTDETQNRDKKSLRVLTGKNQAWAALAQDCVCFANGRGGSILIGIEDEAESPDPDQQIPTDLLGRLRKRIYGREAVASLDLASTKVLSHRCLIEPDRLCDGSTIQKAKSPISQTFQRLGIYRAVFDRPAHKSSHPTPQLFMGQLPPSENKQYSLSMGKSDQYFFVNGNYMERDIR